MVTIYNFYGEYNIETLHTCHVIQTFHGLLDESLVYVQLDETLTVALIAHEIETVDLRGHGLENLSVFLEEVLLIGTFGVDHVIQT